MSIFEKILRIFFIIAIILYIAGMVNLFDLAPSYGPGDKIDPLPILVPILAPIAMFSIIIQKWLGKDYSLL